MSEYSCQLVSVICCGSLDAADYISDLVMGIKSRLRKLTETTFFVRFRIQYASGMECVLETGEEAGFQCPEELSGLRCAELAMEITCLASCDPEVMKDQLHRTITDISEMNNMMPFFFKEEGLLPV